MNRDVFIHVGLQKTATTWIQVELFQKLKNVYYVRTSDLVNTYIPNDKKVLISHECLAGVPSSNIPCMRFKILRRIKRLYPDASIIVGFREKERWLVSLYSQYIKNGGIYSYSYWMEHIIKEKYLDFEKYKNEIRENFDNVFVYHMRDIKQNKKRFVEELFSFIGEPIPQYDDKKYNKKFSKKKLNVMRRLNKLFKSEYNLSGFFPKTLGSFFRFLVKQVSGSFPPYKDRRYK